MTDAPAEIKTCIESALVRVAGELAEVAAALKQVETLVQLIASAMVAK